MSGLALVQWQEERADEKRAEAERLLASHYHRLRGSVATGFRKSHRKIPRGLHHALSARHPVTRRKLCYPLAITLLEVLEEDAEPGTGARRVYGKTQAYYAKRLGLSMKRGSNGEVHGARFIRTLLGQLVALGLLRKGGRAYFVRNNVRERHPRLVVWLQPWEASLASRYGDALATLPPPSENDNAQVPASNESLRIPGSGCFTDPLLLDPISSGGSGSLRGKEEAPSARSFQISERPTAAANQEGEGIPEGEKLDPSMALDTLGPTALRVLRGDALGKVIQLVAKTLPSPPSTAEGRKPRTSPNRVLEPAASLPERPPLERPHPRTQCAGCDSCNEWAKAWVAYNPPTVASLPRDRRSVRAHATSSSSLGRTIETMVSRLAKDAEEAGAERRRLCTVESALATSVRWRHCGEPDFPFRAEIGGQRWKLQRHADRSLSLIVDGSPVGPIDRWPSTWRR